MKIKLTLLYSFLAMYCLPLAHGQGCIAVRYEMNGDAQNMIGNYAHAQAMGGMGFGNDQTGTANAAYVFDGIHDYLVCNANAPIVTTPSFTISVWAKSAPGFVSNQPLFSQRNMNTQSSSAGSTICMFASLNGMFSFQLRSDNWTNLPLVISEGVLPSGSENWHLYTAVKDGSIMRTYVDGQMIDTTFFTDSDEFVTDIDYVEIGKHTFDGPNNSIFEGSMNDFRVYDCALKPTEVDDLFKENFASLEDIISIADIIIYPNPVTEMVYVKTDALGTQYQIRLLAADGKRLADFNATANVFSVDMYNYPSGIYYVQLQDVETGRVLPSRKLIKQ